MRIGILGRHDSWHVNRLATAGAALDVEVRIAPFERLVGGVGARGVLTIAGEDLFGFDRIVVRGIPPGTLEQVVFRMDALHRLERAGVPVLNPPKAIEACVDKYLASSLLADAGLPTPRTIVCESLDDAMTAFAKLGGRVVVKPIFGSEGRGMVELHDESLAYRTLRTLAVVGSVLYLQEFVPHPGYDLRLLVVGGRVIAAMKRTSPDDFRTNASRGARCSAYEPTADECELALRAAAALGAPLAGVDLLPTEDGRLYVLEANSTPGFQALSACTGVDVAAAIMKFAVAGSW